MWCPRWRKHSPQIDPGGHEVRPIQRWPWSGHGPLHGFSLLLGLVKWIQRLHGCGNYCKVTKANPISVELSSPLDIEGARPIKTNKLTGFLRAHCDLGFGCCFSAWLNQTQNGRDGHAKPRETRLEAEAAWPWGPPASRYRYSMYLVPTFLWRAQRENLHMMRNSRTCCRKQSNTYKYNKQENG